MHVPNECPIHVLSLNLNGNLQAVKIPFVEQSYKCVRNHIFYQSLFDSTRQPFQNTIPYQYSFGHNSETKFFQGLIKYTKLRNIFNQIKFNKIFWIRKCTLIFEDFQILTGSKFRQNIFIWDCKCTSKERRTK